MAKKTIEKGQVRAWQRMLSGRRLDLLSPSALDIEIEDIAHGLARVSRWNGQTVGLHAFSVAQHSVLVTRLLSHNYPKTLATDLLLCLLHDAPEYVISDLISPLKAVLGPEYADVEDRLQRAIHLRFGLPVETARAVRSRIKKMDQIAAYFEAVQLAGFSIDESGQLFGQPPVTAVYTPQLSPLPAPEAQLEFEEMFHRLVAARAEIPPAID